MKGLNWTLLIAATLFLCGCGGSDGEQEDSLGSAVLEAETNDCSIEAQNVFVKQVMDDWYLWFEEIPDVNPTDFNSPQELLDAIRFQRFDSTFSFLSTPEADRQFFSASQFVGFGFGSILLATDDLRVTEVFAGSPARAAGLRRGMRFLTINGQTVEQIVLGGGLSNAFGPSQVGFSINATLDDGAGGTLNITMSKALVNLPTVMASDVFNVGGKTVGYLLFRNFTEPAFDTLDSTFDDFTAAGVTDLVVDLRYNGGGLISVANYLGDLLGGSVTSGQVFSRFEFNSKHRDQDFEFRFSAQPNALNLQRLVFITTGSTASASELMINGMRPFLDVAIVGDNTFGKPVGQSAFEFCDVLLLRPVTFRSVNAAGQTDFFDGLPATCPADDDLGNALGDPAEASLAEALNYVDSGSCTTASSKASKTLLARKAALANVNRQAQGQDGFRALVNAW